jgi:hypothetical protein
MRRLILLLLLTACAPARSYKRFPSAPALPPSAVTARVDRPPGRAVLIGTATVQVKRNESEETCALAALAEARRAGATHAVIQPAKKGLITGRFKGPKCTADAFYLPPQ